MVISETAGPTDGTFNDIADYLYLRKSIVYLFITTTIKDAEDAYILLSGYIISLRYSRTFCFPIFFISIHV